MIGAERLTEIGDALFGDDGPDRRSSIAAGRIASSPRTVAMSSRSPCRSRAREDVQLTRDGDELLLQVDGLRRTIVLPRALMDAPTTGAKMEDGVLRITVPRPRRHAARRDGHEIEARRPNMSEPKRGGRTRVSAGVPDAMADARIAELEERLARLEGEPSMRERGRKMIDRVMPPEASRHFRNAGREQLLGMRSIVDFWIRRIDDAETRAVGDAGRETIEID